jgi:ribosome modulation factor
MGHYVELGYEAFYKGVAKCDCPYTGHMMLDWYHGWDFAQIEDCG